MIFKKVRLPLDGCLERRWMFSTQKNMSPRRSLLRKICEMCFSFCFMNVNKNSLIVIRFLNRSHHDLVL